MRIAITGGIAEGKSTVLGYLRDMGKTVSSADEIARAVFNDPFVNRKLAEAAGLPAPIGAADLRLALAQDPSLRRRVNALMHPEVVRRIVEDPGQFVEIPLLIETCLQGRFDRVWVVTCGEEEQKRRLLERYGDMAHVDAILATQLPTSVKKAFSDLIVRTNVEPGNVRRVVSEAVRAL